MGMNDLVVEEVLLHKCCNTNFFLKSKISIQKEIVGKNQRMCEVTQKAVQLVGRGNGRQFACLRPVTWKACVL